MRIVRVDYHCEGNDYHQLKKAFLFREVTVQVHCFVPTNSLATFLFWISLCWNQFGSEMIKQAGIGIGWLISRIQPGAGVCGWAGREGRAICQQCFAVSSAWAKQTELQCYQLQHLCALYPWGYKCLLAHNRWLVKNVVFNADLSRDLYYRRLYTVHLRLPLFRFQVWGSWEKADA